MALPASLSFFMARLEGVSSSRFRISPQGSTTVSPNQIVRFQLPSNTLINLKNMALIFNLETTGATTNATFRLPANNASLIDRLAVYMGGVLVGNGWQGFNVLCHAKAALTGKKSNSALEHPAIARSKSYVDGSTLAADANEAYTDEEDRQAILYFDGFLGTAEPSIIDLGMLPSVVLEFTMADANVVSTSEGIGLGVSGTDGFQKDGVGTPNYSVSNITLQCEVLGMSSNILETISEQRIASVGFLEIPFKNYFTSIQSHGTGTSRFNINSSSFDRLWVAYRADSYATKGAPKIVNGYKTDGAYVAATSGGTVNVAVGIPQYDAGGVLGTNTELYQSKYFQFKQQASGVVKTQLQVNNANIPAYNMNTPESLAMSLGAIDSYSVEPTYHMTLDQYKNNYYVQVFRFCLPDADVRLASGLSTRSVSAQCALVSEGLNSTQVWMFAECTSSLRVANNRQIEVIV